MLQIFLLKYFLNIFLSLVQWHAIYEGKYINVAKAVTKRVCNDLRCITRNLNFIFWHSIDSTCGEVCTRTYVQIYTHLLGNILKILLNFGSVCAWVESTFVHDYIKLI